MSREAFRVFLAVVIVVVLVGGGLLGWHFSHQHQACTTSGNTIPATTVCHTVYG